jgi:hypothetical protein
MTRKCTICGHPDRKAIDRAILQGESFRGISRKHSLSEDALQRHVSKNHMVSKIARAEEAKELAQAATLLDQVKDLQQRAMGILAKAEAADDLRTALQGVKEVRSCLELLAKVTGELESGPQVNILMAPEWVQIRTTILQVLEPYPEARMHLVERLREVEG